MPALTIERQQTDIIKSVLNIRNPEILKDLRSYIKKKDKQEAKKGLDKAIEDFVKQNTGTHSDIFGK